MIKPPYTQVAMAPTVMPCPVTGCQYATPEIELLAAVEIFKAHQLEHTQQPPQVGGQAFSVKPPKLNLG